VPGNDTPYHHGSHQSLLWPPPADFAPAQRGVDAIVVPTARPPAYLTEAAELARTLDRPLVTLHSGKWTTAARAAQTRKMPTPMRSDDQRSNYLAGCVV